LSDKLYSNDYFKDRKLNNEKRLSSFNNERIFLRKFFNFDGIVCDVGCSTGEFLHTIGWSGKRYGMEVNLMAINEAKKKDISFNASILNKKNFFDVIVFRGTIQHLPDPFGYIERSYSALKKGGYIVFLATPNANSICYKIFNTSPLLDKTRNFFIPSDITLSNVLKMNNFKRIEIEFPYLNSPYSNLLLDHFNFLRCFFFSQKPNFPFWKNMMNVVAQK
jgi:SAM-dependent methyltransferase